MRGPGCRPGTATDAAAGRHRSRRPCGWCGLCRRRGGAAGPGRDPAAGDSPWIRIAWACMRLRSPAGEMHTQAAFFLGVAHPPSGCGWRCAEAHRRSQGRLLHHLRLTDAPATAYDYRRGRAVQECPAGIRVRKGEGDRLVRRRNNTAAVRRLRAIGARMRAFDRGRQNGTVGREAAGGGPCGRGRARLDGGHRPPPATPPPREVLPLSLTALEVTDRSVRRSTAVTALCGCDHDVDRRPTPLTGSSRSRSQAAARAVPTFHQSVSGIGLEVAHRSHTCSGHHATRRRPGAEADPQRPSGRVPDGMS